MEKERVKSVRAGKASAAAGRRKAAQVLARLGAQRRPPAKRGPLRWLAVIPPRLWGFAGIALLAGLLLWWLGTPPRPAMPPAPAPAGQATATGGGGGDRAAVAGRPEAVPPGEGILLLKGVRLEPALPTRQDRLRAVPEAAPGVPEELSLTYAWRVNDQEVAGVEGNTLALDAFRPGDLVTVTVTPAGPDGAVGAAVTSPVARIHPAPPTLTLADVRQQRKVGEPLELQLLATAPDGRLAGFHLVDPRLPGMSLDGQTGRIVWHLQPDQRGVQRFGAAVADDHGTRVTRTFEITVD